MPHRGFAILTVAALILTFYSCGGDSPTGSQPDSGSKDGVITGTVTTTDSNEGIEDALLELIKSDSVIQKTYSNTDGKYNFDRVESGQYQVELTLPQGFKESGTTSKTIQIDNDVSVEFEGEPIKEETTTVKAGEQDTIATASGAFVSIDASGASSDMEVTISEVESETESERGSKPVKIHIRPPGSSQSSVSPAKRMVNSRSTSATSVDVRLGQKVKNTGPGSLVFNVESEEGTISLYADPEQETIVDTKTNKESIYYTHSISTAPTTDSEFSLYYKRVDNSCDNDYRILESVPSDQEGRISLILVHGLQPTLGLCEDFNTYDPLDREDFEINTFDKLVSNLLSDSAINDKYRLYTYKYPTNAPIQEASNDLWNQIEDNDQIQKPVILAHSMGGLVARKMVATEGDETVRGLITLGSPHNGTPIANSAEWISNAIRASCLSPLYWICLADIYKGGILPNSPGLRDLRKENVEEEFNTSDVKKDKIYTLGGDLGERDNIANNNSSVKKTIYKFGLGLMNILNKKSDGMVPVGSATPYWTSRRLVLEGHDHSEMKDGNELNSNSVFKHIQKILSLLSQDEAVPSLEVTPDSLEFPVSSSEKTLNISNTGTGTLEWEVSSSANWLSFTPSSGTGSSDITVFAEENTSNQLRTTEITVNSNGGKTEYISVSQEKSISSTNGLIVYYPLNGKVNDESGNGVDGVIHGNPEFEEGVLGQAIRFDGNGDFIQTNDSEYLRVNDSFTFAAWILSNQKDSLRKTIAVQGTDIDTDGNWEIYLLGDKTIRFNANNYSGNGGNPVAGVESTGRISLQNWHHIAITFSSGTTKFYIDGELDSTKDFGTSAFNNTSDGIKIGDREYTTDKTDDFNGLIDQVYIYNRTLSKDEIQKLFNE